MLSWPTWVSISSTDDFWGAKTSMKWRALGGGNWVKIVFTHLYLFVSIWMFHFLPATRQKKTKPLILDLQVNCLKYFQVPFRKCVITEFALAEYSPNSVATNSKRPDEDSFGWFLYRHRAGWCHVKREQKHMSKRMWLSPNVAWRTHVNDNPDVKLHWANPEFIFCPIFKFLKCSSV